MSHLWEHKHPYYASESNFYSNEPGERFESWAEFIATWGRNDLDLNLLIRWDWIKCDPSDYDPGEMPPTMDEMQLTYVLQRKGIYLANFVHITEDDEPAIREFLLSRWERLASIWSGIAPVSGEGEP